MSRSKGHATFAPRILGSHLDDLSPLLHLLLLADDPGLASLLDHPLPGLVVGGFRPRIQHVDVVHALDDAGDVAAAAVGGGSANSEDEVELDVLGVGVVLEDTGAETGADGGLGDHGALVVVFGVELADGAAAAAERGVEAVEEAGEAAGGGDVGGFGVAEPLDGGDADGGVEGARAEGDALAHVGEEEVALDVALEGDVEHGGGDVHADPGVGPAVFGELGGEDFAGEAAAATDVEDEGGGFEVEDFEGAPGHGGLDVLDARGGGVFAGFGVIVVDVRRAEER